MIYSVDSTEEVIEKVIVAVGQAIEKTTDTEKINALANLINAKANIEYVTKCRQTIENIGDFKMDSCEIHKFLRRSRRDNA